MTIIGTNTKITSVIVQLEINAIKIPTPRLDIFFYKVIFKFFSQFLFLSRQDITIIICDFES